MGIAWGGAWEGAQAVHEEAQKNKEGREEHIWGLKYEGKMYGLAWRCDMATEVISSWMSWRETGPNNDEGMTRAQAYAPGSFHHPQMMKRVPGCARPAHFNA